MRCRWFFGSNTEGNFKATWLYLFYCYKLSFIEIVLKCGYKKKTYEQTYKIRLDRTENARKEAIQAIWNDALSPILSAFDDFTESKEEYAQMLAEKRKHLGSYEKRRSLERKRIKEVQEKICKRRCMSAEVGFNL